MLAVLLTVAAALGLALDAATLAQPAPVAAIKVEKDQIQFLAGKDVVTTYQIKDSWPRPFFWPVKAPDGTESTRAWPMGEPVAADAKEGKKPDHIHHRSVWFTYGDVVPEGMKLKTKLKGVEGVDFWSEGNGRGSIVCTKVGEPKTTERGASVVTQNEWRTAEGDKVLDETRTIYFYNFGKAYLLVLDIDLFASQYPITFADTKEGAMAIRIHSEAKVEKPGKGKMQNAEGGINEAKIWGLKSAWCDYSGPVGGKVIGVALLDDPANPYAACWHARDYGLMGANPFGREKHAKFPAMKGNNTAARLAKGDHLRLRYGVLVHNGDAGEAGVEGYYQRFVKLRDLEK
jgi:hypothetical protein